MKQDKMMICPKAKECDRECTDKKSHLRSKGCRDKRLYPTFSDGSVCPACIPVEPEPKTTSILCMDCNKPIFECICKFFVEPQPATCPDCGHPVSMHDVVDGCMQKLPFAKDSYSYCSCDKFPADQPEIALTHEERVDLSNQAFDKFIQPMPMMPLREQLADFYWHFTVKQGWRLAGHELDIRAKSYEFAKELMPLIASEQAEHDIEVADVAFDKGFDVGKTETKIEAEAKYKPMVEALSLARFHIAYLKGGMNPEDRLPSTDKVLAKIDAVLPKGEGK